jgi:hypothetical protein
LPGRYASWGLDAVGVAALALILLDFLTVHDFETSLYRGGFLLLAIWTALLVGVLAHPAARLGPLLAQGPVLWLGVRSYSFYLWHWPILALTRPDVDVDLDGVPLTALQLAATLVLAHLSYTYVEQPFRRAGGVRKPDLVRLGRFGLAAGVTVVVVLVGWSGIAPIEEASRPRAASAQVTAERGPPGVLAIGDSVMVGAQPGLVSKLGPQLTLNATVGRSAADVVALLRAYRAEGKVPRNVVVQVGANGPIGSAELDDLIAVLRPITHVYLVSVLVPRSWEAESNRAIRRAAEQLPNATLIDWHRAAAGKRELTDDGAHLTAAGNELYSTLIARAVAAGDARTARRAPGRRPRPATGG